MGIAEVFLLALGLSGDAFAAALGKGLSVGRTKMKEALFVGLWFGAFQALMPCLGFFLSRKTAGAVMLWGPFFSAALLMGIGLKAVTEALKKQPDEANEGINQKALSVKNMALSALATSLDAFAAGIAYAFSAQRTALPVFLGVIGLTTFLISCAGVKIGGVFGGKYKKSAEISGGVILLLLAVKALAQGLSALAGRR